MQAVESQADPQEELTDDERLQLWIDWLDNFGESVAKDRSEAIAYRQNSGIEEIWREDQEFYEGVDDLNRFEERAIRHEKPPLGPTKQAIKGLRNQSRVFPNITAPFVDAAAAHISDILLPTDEPPWKLEPTPIPEIDELAKEYVAKNKEQANADAADSGLDGVDDPAQAPQRAESEAASQAQVDQPDMTPEQAFDQKEIARAVAEATGERIWDWHVECQFNAQMRRVIEDASKVGVGILKGPIVTEEKIVGWQPETAVRDKVTGQDVMQTAEIVVKKEIKPSSKRISYWNFYPAAGCGDNIQNGDGVWERDFYTKRQMIQLAGDSTYIRGQVLKCIDEGPTRAAASVEESSSVNAGYDKHNKFEVWFYHGLVDWQNLENAGHKFEEGELDEEQQFVEAHIVMVNNHVIKATVPLTEYAGYPYDVICWRKRENFWAGIGVARSVRVAQKIVVGGTRSMMNNAGLAGGPMIVFKQGVVFPADKLAGIGPRKVFYIKRDDTSIQDATKAIGSIKVDMVVNELLAIINYGLQMAENNSGFPMLTQGQMGRAPDRVGVVNVLDKNTNAIKRRFARNFSDDVMAPHLKRYYIYHLIYGPDKEKGDLQINVKGYQAQVERDIQNQELGQMYNIVLDPRFGIDPRKWVAEYLKSRNLNAKDIEFDDEKWEELVNNWQAQVQAGQQDWRIQVANINAQARLQQEQMKGDYKGAMFLNEHQANMARDELDRQFQIAKELMHRDIEEMKLSGITESDARKIKADLAKKVMDLNATFDLAKLQAPASALPTPPIEPPGRAPDGMSFQR